MARLGKEYVLTGAISLALIAGVAQGKEQYTIRYAQIRAVGEGKYSIQFKEKKVTLDQLLKELRDNNPEVREDAMRAIASSEEWPKRDSPQLIKAMGERLKDKEARIRFDAAETLSRVGAGSVAVLPALMEAVKDKDALIRSRALGAVAQIGPKAKPAIDGLITALEDEHEVIADIAADALGNIGAAAVPELIKALESKKP